MMTEGVVMVGLLVMAETPAMLAMLAILVMLVMLVGPLTRPWMVIT